MLRNPLIAFFKLIRIENLLIIAVTQICIKYLVLAPLNEYSKFTPFLFIVSLVSTLLIAAAGYIINDYFDVKTDKINRPNTVVVDVSIKRRWAMLFHIALNAIGLLLGLYLALKCNLNSDKNTCYLTEYNGVPKRPVFMDNRFKYEIINEQYVDLDLIRKQTLMHMRNRKN